MYITRRYKPEDLDLDKHRHESLKTRIRYNYNLIAYILIFL